MLICVLISICYQVHRRFIHWGLEMLGDAIFATPGKAQEEPSCESYSSVLDWCGKGSLRIKYKSDMYILSFPVIILHTE